MTSVVLSSGRNFYLFHVSQNSAFFWFLVWFGLVLVAPAPYRSPLGEGLNLHCCRDNTGSSTYCATAGAPNNAILKGIFMTEKLVVESKPYCVAKTVQVHLSKEEDQ